MRMGFDVHKLVPSAQRNARRHGPVARRAIGRSRPACVWLEAHGLEPKMSPFDPTAMLDEIQRLVPGYDVSRLELAGGKRSAHIDFVQMGPGDAAAIRS